MPGSRQVVERASCSKKFVRLEGIASRRLQTLRFWHRLRHLGNARLSSGSRLGLEPWVGRAGLGTRAGVSPQLRADREGPTHPQPLLCFVSSGFTSVPGRWRVYRPLAQARRKTPLKRQATSTQAEREEPRRTQHSPVVRLHQLCDNQSAQSGRLATHSVTQGMFVPVVCYIHHTYSGQTVTCSKLRTKLDHIPIPSFEFLDIPVDVIYLFICQDCFNDP